MIVGKLVVGGLYRVDEEAGLEIVVGNTAVVIPCGEAFLVVDSYMSRIYSVTAYNVLYKDMVGVIALVYSQISDCTINNVVRING